MPAPILVVEDYDLDFEVTERGFRRLGVTNPIVRAVDGQRALDWLHGSRPALVLLDLNLPKVDGRTVLRQIKSDSRLREVPVVVWSATELAEDIADAYRCGANSFVPKRMSPREQQRDLESISRYWLETVRLPAHAA